MVYKVQPILKIKQGEDKFEKNNLYKLNKQNIGNIYEG